ncbi:cytochrome c oxidase subunit II [Prauserella muralis]|uniref:cytochrome-c oxidase n=1 Tax=Prauserella muralis TaxID=588067 RepID=A0A2V4B288_9PSEU|nr:cytochrome c oxidase subunit II [Prauserella muralis]PXY27255.1 cytochrome c oxidase subunit II [Prauserella muralis]TWE23082.1 cytochrome c oxidase subunit 2 [Prauserella muralis]
MGVTQRTRGSRPGRVAKVTGLAGLVAVLATGCSGSEVLRFGWPEGVTPESEHMRTLWTWSVIAALVVGVVVWGLIFWSVAFHRKKKGTVEALPRQFQYNVPLELFCVVIPVVMVCVLFFFTATTESRVLAKEADPDVVVDVTAFQWNWEFAYPEEAKTPNGQPVSTVGSSTEIPLLVLPTDRTIEYRLRSTDVIHSFWVPEFHFKRDVFPYPEKNNQDNVFQNSIDREGAFVGRCAELCGTYHAMMNFEVRALSPDKFDRYLQLRTRINQETGQPNTAAEALRILQGEGCDQQLCSPTATTTKPFATDRTLRTASG